MNIKEDSRIGHPLFDFCIFIHFILFTIIKFRINLKDKNMWIVVGICTVVLVSMYKLICKISGDIE